MTRLLPLVTGALRLCSVGLAVFACAVLVGKRAPGDAEPGRLGGAGNETGGVVAQALDAPSDDAAAAAGDPRSWFVRADGWQIRVDRAALDFPTVAESFAARPRTVPQAALSPFDPLIQYYAAKKGFDWRFIAAIIEAESGFDPRATSPRGAYGLMQVRDIAARAVGETSFRQPADNIRTGVQYLRKLEKYVPNARGRDRLMLLLAAYNAGPGHLADAQQLAREHGLDPNRWYGGVREVLPALQNPAIYPSLRHGFARGSDVVVYVEGIWQRFLEFQRATTGGIFAGPDPRSSGAWLAADSRTARG